MLGDPTQAFSRAWSQSGLRQLAGSCSETGNHIEPESYHPPASKHCRLLGSAAAPAPNVTESLGVFTGRIQISHLSLGALLWSTPCVLVSEAAVTNHHKCRGLEQHKFVTILEIGSLMTDRLTGWKSRLYFFLEAPKENLFPCLFRLPGATHISGLPYKTVSVLTLSYWESCTF